MAFTHEKVETNNTLMIVLILIVLAVGGMVEIVPLFFQKSTTEPIKGITPDSALKVVGRDIYIREGCYNCHSQMIRMLSFETQRYGHYSVAGESVYDRPFQWGSKRTGPDLARVGARYSDDWHKVHLINPRDLVPESNMPGYPWLAENSPDVADIQSNMRVLKFLDKAYTDEEIAKAGESLAGKTELDALVAYLQNLGNHTDFNAMDTPAANTTGGAGQ